MSGRELDAAGISDPELRTAYTCSRRLNAQYGKTFYLATKLLPPHKRPYVHALYGFARYADDIVDDLDCDLEPVARARHFGEWSDRVTADLARGSSDDLVCRALIDTLRRWEISIGYVGEFLDSMRMDLTVSQYESDADLQGYVRGSAAVIGLQMLPILGRADGPVDVSMLERCAQDLGIAFQLTNFLRDVGEDLRRGRVYLPQDSLRRFGVDRSRLEAGRVDDDVRSWLAFEIERTRAVYTTAARGIELVHPTSRPCLRAAITLYGAILDAIEDADYDVLSGRVAVGRLRRARVGVGGLVNSWAARAGCHRPSHTHHDNVVNTRQKPNSRSSTGA